MNMGEIAERIRRGRAGTDESRQVRRAFFAWYNRLPWLERRIGTASTLKEGNARLLAFEGAASRFGAEARSTLRAGATGDDVIVWQKILGITPTGTMDPATITATKAWQRTRGLSADGVVGPLTWGAAPEPPKTATAAVASSFANLGKIGGDNMKQYALVGGAGLFGLAVAFGVSKATEKKR